MLELKPWELNHLALLLRRDIQARTTEYHRKPERRRRRELLEAGRLAEAGPSLSALRDLLGRIERPQDVLVCTRPREEAP